MAGSTFNAHIGLLRLVWRVLRKKTKAERNPWAEISKKRIAGTGRRQLTLEELRAVCAKATGELQALLALGLYTGLGLGDCATLRWGRVLRVAAGSSACRARVDAEPLDPMLRGGIVGTRGCMQSFGPPQRRTNEMKVIGFSESPRKDANTDRLLPLLNADFTTRLRKRPAPVLAFTQDLRP